jgi:anti-sigma B factor antagonist
MELIQERNGSKLTISIVGDLNTMTAPELEAILGDNLADVEELVFDLKDMPYTSSAGLRAFLGAQQDMDEKDASMIIRNANEFVLEIFEETGFNNILDIEE